MILPEEAWQRLEPHLPPLGPVEVARRESAGRVLARAVSATADLPGWDASAMDGYAWGGSVTLGRPVPVAGRIVAGDPPGFMLPAGQAVRIMTGAPVPAGADRIVPVEDARSPDPTRVVFEREAPPNAHIRFRGEVLRAGAPLLPPGTVLTPGAMSLLAAHGVEQVAVVRPPQVSFLVTGSELVSPGQVPGPGQLRDSHSDFLLAAGAALGLSFRSLGIAPDETGELGRRLEEGLAESDVLLLTGGVSMGELDLVEGVLDRLGYAPLFDAVAIQPGKPLVVSTPRGPGRRARLVFGLPGNPASVMVAFYLFVRPALRRLAGFTDGLFGGVLEAELAAPLAEGGARDRFLPAQVSFSAGRPVVLPFPPRGSHDVAAYAHGTALLRIRAGAAPQPAGARCEVLPLVHWPPG
jgi:molybdopterin molybdotransferase